MFGLFNKKNRISNDAGTSVVTLKISGMHCVACSLNIDGELEDLPGVKSAKTSYAKSETVVEFNSKQITPAKIMATIKKTGYEVVK